VVPWQDHIKAFFARATGSGNYTWQRPDRRMIVRDLVGLGDAIYVPSQTGFGADTIVVVGDSSGSVTDPQLDRIMGEVSGILEDIKPKRLVLIWCDHRIQRVDEVEEISDLNVIRAKGAPGRGGTSFVPPFREVKQMGLEPEALIYITDGMGTFPTGADIPRYPVIWASILKDRAHYPFGDFVKVPV
jgi:predicted metal-dependent peptidase